VNIARGRTKNIDVIDLSPHIWSKKDDLSDENVVEGSVKSVPLKV